MKIIRLSILTLLYGLAFEADSLTINRIVGWNETAAVEWNYVPGATAYTVSCMSADGYVSELDPELIRFYQGYARADMPGLRPGNYTFTVTALDSDMIPLETAVSDEVTASAFIREGFAFRDGFIPGAYNSDGTPKDDAQIIYVTDKTVNTVSLTVINDAKGKTVDATGLSAILKARERGYDKTPLIIRVIGQISASDVDGLKGGNYITFIGANSDKRMIENITLEGIGCDATLYGFGVFTKRSHGIEIRNLSIMLFGDDGISMEADNFNIWVHHCDFFYGKPGKDSDQAKGDGSIDMKYNTTDITIDHNHFFDSGKTTFAGGATEDGPIYFTYHRNWFDHTDSRCPRLCHASAHIYNNYFDANPTMCLLSTENSSAFVENNYYRNCPSPMEINMQGTNRRRWPDGTQNGGMNKGYNNIIEGDHELITQHDNPTDFDVYMVDSPEQPIPADVKSLKGGNTYDNFDTAPDMYTYTADDPAEVPGYIMANAGRMEGGDIKWTFDKATDDKSTAIDTQLKNLLLTYRSSRLDNPVLTGIASTMAVSDIRREIFDLSGQRCAGWPALPGIYLVKEGYMVKKIQVK